MLGWIAYGLTLWFMVSVLVALWIAPAMREFGE